MSTLVTGGTGFIGAQVVRILLEKGEKDIVVFDINPSTKLLDDVADQVEFVRGDLGNFTHVLSVVKTRRPKVIYHLGGMLSVPSDADNAASFRANAMGTFHVLEAARLFEVPQVLFSSTLATYGLDIREDVINDFTLQRPQLFYGTTKVFCELMGLFYKRKFGLDYRGVRYPSIVGPGVKTPGVVQYTSWVIEECAKGNSYTMYVKPETKCPVMYFKDAAQAIVMLQEAPLANIKMVNYVIAGATPIASAQELADIVKARISTAQITFEPDLELQKILDKLLLRIDDSIARKEWSWMSEYNQERIVDDFIEELKAHPQRYA
ncbi:MAG TPA: NAD-dependent epimerase/dehydratase family protein [Desulfatiglandales bacterium]|nr:NAD-dependent epimerase/dehydratase family protein [Desulfatiglandales bacterium]